MLKPASWGQGEMGCGSRLDTVESTNWICVACTVYTYSCIVKGEGNMCQGGVAKYIPAMLGSRRQGFDGGKRDQMHNTYTFLYII